VKPDVDETAPQLPSPTAPAGSGLRVIEAPALFGKASEVRIRHNAVEYRLCITRQGKLILTK
jgi:hemin uptake protein HemP